MRLTDEPEAWLECERREYPLQGNCSLGFFHERPPGDFRFASPCLLTRPCLQRVLLGKTDSRKVKQPGKAAHSVSDFISLGSRQSGGRSF